jgi:hypothetical protein
MASKMAAARPALRKCGKFSLIFGLICGVPELSGTFSPVFALKKLSSGKKEKLSLKNSQNYLLENEENPNPDNERIPGVRLRDDCIMYVIAFNLCML